MLYCLYICFTLRVNDNSPNAAHKCALPMFTINTLDFCLVCYILFSIFFLDFCGCVYKVRLEKGMCYLFYNIDEVLRN